MDLKDFLLSSATTYHQYLINTNKGIEKIQIKSFSIFGNLLSIFLDQKLFSTDYLLISINGLILDLDTIEAKKYDDRTRSLVIYLDEEFINSLDKDSIELDIQIDLKFLVKNIITFLESSPSISFNPKNPIPLNAELFLKNASFANKEQKDAIKGIFSHKLSYIWGISGSGKTQVVLLNAILNLLYQGKKALILAPTNNALEQIFIALIKNLDSLGIPRETCIRLGMPSAEFLGLFSEVCEGALDEEGSLFKIAKKNLSDFFVIGCTADAFAKRFSSFEEVDFSHVFLDECAFCPLIKVIPALLLDTPITLLGDHKQLPPVFLADANILKQRQELIAWQLSTLFLESMLKDFRSLNSLDIYSPKLEETKQFSLTITHRYGSNLARILDRHVYKNNLSATNKDIDIFYLDSSLLKLVDTLQEDKNTSLKEARQIKILYDSLAQSRISDFIILTPFKAQVDLIIKQGIPRSKVCTIHKSQGREFDYVILSPVCLHYYLTNSNNKAALLTLNVAISRLKKALILVCDYYMWMDLKGQFLQSILKEARAFDWLLR